MNAAILELPHAHLPARRPLERIGFELGRDYAHYRVAPPAPYAEQPSALRSGLLAGRATFGVRTLQPTPATRKWLQLRLHAWLRGRSVELFQVTPHFLRQLEVSHCPITRVALSADHQPGSEASIDRVRNAAGYAAGNLALMSARANHAKGAHDFRSAQRLVQAAAPDDRGSAGLSTAQWARVATLCSYVEPLAHAEAAALPMLLLPPNRLRLFNPVQALQALLSAQLLEPGWSQRYARFEDLLRGAAPKRDLKAFVMALLPRVLEAGPLTERAAMRWAIEDAWRNALVQKRWQAFAAALDVAQCEALLRQAARKNLATTHVEPLPDALAIEGWNLETRGYAPHDVAPPAPESAAGPQLRLALQPG